MLVFPPTASASIWWPRQMPNSGFFVSSIAWITGTAYSPVAAGSPGPFDRKKPSGSCAMISSKVAVAGTTVTRAPASTRVAEDVALVAIIDRDDVRARPSSPPALA